VTLIGRLRLSPSNAIEAYEKLVPVIPTHAAKGEEERKTNTEAFKAVFVKVLEDAGFDKNTPMLEKDGPPSPLHYLSIFRTSISPLPIAQLKSSEMISYLRTVLYLNITTEIISHVFVQSGLP
jgi:hypothetical protein